MEVKPYIDLLLPSCVSRACDQLYIKHSDPFSDWEWVYIESPPVLPPLSELGSGRLVIFFSRFLSGGDQSWPAGGKVAKSKVGRLQFVVADIHRSQLRMSNNLEALLEVLRNQPPSPGEAEKDDCSKRSCESGSAEFSCVSDSQSQNSSDGNSIVRFHLTEAELRNCEEVLRRLWRFEAFLEICHFQYTIRWSVRFST